MSRKTIQEVTQIIMRCQIESKQLFNLAIETAETEARHQTFRSDAELCDLQYETALEKLEAGDIETACKMLENAQRIEQDGGDDQDARRALAALADAETPTAG